MTHVLPIFSVPSDSLSNMLITRSIGKICHTKFFASKFQKSILLLTMTLLSLGTSALADQVSLAWDANTESYLGGYRLYYGQASGNYTVNVDVGNQTSYTVLGLQKGITYYFAVTAYDNTNTVESDYSNEVNWLSPDDPIPNDPDSDGLTTTEEETLGTNPNDADSDDDGVEDGDEVQQTTNPVDPGSYLEVLGTTLCSEWNGYLGMWNVMEHLNTTSSKISILTKLYSNGGQEQSQTEFKISGGRQYDLLVHDLNGHIDDSYGKVCSSTTGSPGDLDIRMVYYKPDYNSNNELSGYQFAFAMPVTNGLPGNQFVPYNTFQPSLDPSDQSNLVANWIQVTNLESTEQEGALIFYAMSGEQISQVAVTLAGGARSDFSGHDAVGTSKVGFVAWQPVSSTARFQVRNVRYLYRADLTNFDAAFQLEGTRGSGETLSAPLDTNGSSAIVELANTLNEQVSVLVQIFGEDGGTALYSKTHKLDAHETYHLITDQILDGASGIAVVKGNKANSVVATVMQYSRTASLGIQSLYGIQAKEALGSTLKGSYNTFLGQSCRLLVTNPTSSENTVSISMRRYDGETPLADHSETIPANGLLDYNLCTNDSADVYGVVTIESTTANGAYATVLRVGDDNQYRFPTIVRP